MGNWTRIDVEDEEFQKAKQAAMEAGIGHCDFATQPVVFEPLNTTFLAAEYKVVDIDLVLHVFHPDKSLERPWLSLYAQQIFDAILDEFRLREYPERLHMEYTPEVNGWYILIKRVANFTDPDPRRLERMLDSVGSQPGV